MDDESLPAADFDLLLGDKTDISYAPPECTWVEPIETRAPVPNARDMPGAAAGPESSGVAPVTRVVARTAVRRSLAEIWPEPPRKRQLPKPVRLVLVGSAVLLVAIIAFGTKGTKLQKQAPAPLADDMIVSADELRNRREVRPDDFRPRGAAQPVGAPGPARVATPGAPTPPTAPETLAERRARRQHDPEDSPSPKIRRTTGKPPVSDAPWDDGPVYVTTGSASDAGDARSSPQPTAPSGERNAVLVPAGTSVPAALTSSLELRRGNVTVIARADSQVGAVRAARFIGTASAAAGRVTIGFHAAILADGQKVRVDGEAQDEDGAFGLRNEGEPPSPAEERGAVLAEVASETATDHVSDAIGVGIATRAVDRYMNGARSRRAIQPAGTVSLAAGTKLQIFLHEPLELGQ